MLRLFLNSDSYTLKVRGSKPDHKKLKRDGEKLSRNCQSIPIKYTQELRIYVMAKIGKDVTVCGIQEVKQTEHMRKMYYKTAQETRVFQTKLEQIKQIID